MPNVPQDVPVENARKQATRKMMAGKNALKPAALPSTKEEIKILAPKESVIPFSVQAQIRIIMAGTIALKPSGTDSIHCLKEITLLHIK